MKYTLTLILSLLFSYCFTACKTPSLIESFSTQFGLMHFVKSVEFSGKDGKAEFDFTYRENDSMLVACNFTLESESPDIYALQSAAFKAGGETIELDSLKLMFATRTESSARYASVITKERFRKLFSQNAATFIARGKSRALVFDGGKSFRKNAEAARLDVLNLP